MGDGLGRVRPASSHPLNTLEDLRRAAVARNFPPPATLKRVLHRMGFVQADPIRAPARAQDLTLRHRVTDYRAGDLERRYATLGVEEDFFVTYGFVTRELQALMHPRSETGVPADAPTPWPPQRRKKAPAAAGVRARARRRAPARGRRALRARHGHELLGRLVERDDPSAGRDALPRPAARGAARERHPHLRRARARPGAGRRAARRARIDALVDVVVRLYAPLPARSLSIFVRRLRYAVPQWRGELDGRAAAGERAARARARRRRRLVLAGATKGRSTAAPAERVRLLTPFDPLVRDRHRFELLWGWVYRFEAYTPASQRKLGYYALPLLWRDRVIGWGNLSVKNGELESEIGYVGSAPRDRAFKRELAAELDRMRSFLGLQT